jgi:hypothetical protein
LGTAATTNASAYATAAQGAKADTAVQTIASADGSVTITGTTAIDLSVAVATSTSNVVLPVRNITGATLTKGTAVYISGATGQISTVSKAIATGDATSAQTLGLITANLANNANGNVTLIGTITNMDTSAYTDGQQLYLSPTTAGTLTATKPYAPQHLVYMAVVEHAHPTQGKLFVKVQNGYEMDELHDVSAQSPANNDGLFYNTTTSLWEKKSIVTALGYTPYNATNPAGYTTNTGTVTSVGGTGTVSGLTLTGTVTTSGNLTLGGTLSLTSENVTTALGYTPYNATNPAGYITSSALSSYLPLTGGTLTGKLAVGNVGSAFGASEVNLALTGANGFFNSSLLFASENTNFRYQNKFFVDTGALVWQNSTDGTNYTERMRINSSGDIGIGTTAPNSKLHVSFSPPGSIPALGSGVGGVAIGPASSYGTLLGTISDGTGYIQQQRFDAGTAVYPLALQPNGGNVGIGTNGTSGRLSVKSATGTVGFNAGTSSSPERGNLWYDTDNSGWSFNIGKLVGSTFSPQMTFQDNGNVSIGTTSALGGRVTILGSAAGAGFLGFDTDATRVDIQSYNKPLAINRQGNNTLMNEGGGNVGIGVSSPAYKLDVNGPIRIPSGFSGAHYNMTYAGNENSRSWRILNDFNLYGDFVIQQSTTQTGSTYASQLYINPTGSIGIGTISPASKLTVTGGVSAAGIFNALTLQNSLDGGVGLYFDNAVSSNLASIEALVTSAGAGTDDGILAFSTASDATNTERMRINQVGNVGIGTQAPLSRLDVRETNRADSTNIANVGIYTTTAQSTGVGGTLALGGLFNGSDNAPFGSIRGGKQNSTNNNYDGYLAFQTIANGGVLTENMRITAAGNVNISNGNLVIGTALKGIDFSANSHAAGMTSELLNDYEEGTFTPTLSSSGTAPTVSGYINRFGTYTKIGNRVFISVNIRATITNAGTGTPEITGFPYASSGNALNGVSLGLTDLMNVTFNANFISGSALILALSSYNVASSAYITFSAMYEI